MKDFFPKVSVIVAIEKIGKYTIKSIKSIFSQTHTNTEVIIYGKKEQIELLKSKFKDKCYYHIIDSFNLVSILNKGIIEAKGEYISFLFNDDILNEDTIEKELVSFSKSNEKTACVISYPFDGLSKRKQEVLKNGQLPALFLLTENFNYSSILFKKDILKNNKFSSKHHTIYMEYQLLSLLEKYKVDVVNCKPLKMRQNNYYDEKELIEFWNCILKDVNEKEIVNLYHTKHNFYVEGVEIFKKLNLIFPKSLHDKFINNKFNPLISVIIPVYNGSNYIKQSIESVLSQTYTNYELIVVEDGSNDGGKTQKCVLEYEDKLKYFNKENGGVGSALNLGIKKAKGKYISWLSHDDMFYPEKLQMSVDALNELGNKDTIVFSNFQLMDENSVPYVDTNFQNRFSIQQLENKIFPVLNGCTNGCAMIIPKVAFDTCGLFDVSQRTTNDYIMWFNIFKEYPSKFLKEHLIKYRIHQAQDTQSSPVYIPESEEMWTSVFKKITKKEIESYGYDELEFYAKFYNEMKLGKLVKTTNYLEEQYKKIYKKKGPLVTVIMPCYNSEKHIEEAIESVLNQTFAAFELICIDDSSTDNTYQILKEYEKKDFRIRVLKNTHKKGVSGAMNTGLDNARGKYITRIDSDDISYPEQLMKEYDFLKNNNEYGTCSVNMDLRKNGKVYGKCEPFKDNTPIEWKFLWDNPYPNAPSMFRKELVKNIRFDENLSVAEDYHFFMRLAPYKIHYIDEVLYSYRIDDNSLYHSNKLKSIYTSIEVASNYYHEITGKTHLPEIYYYLSFFSDGAVPSYQLDKKEALDFINETLDSFSNYFKWNEEEYAAAKMYALSFVYTSFIEKIVNNTSYEVKEYNRMLESTSWKVTKPLRATKDIISMGTRFVGRIISRGKK